MKSAGLVRLERGRQLLDLLAPLPPPAVRTWQPLFRAWSLAFGATRGFVALCPSLAVSWISPKRWLGLCLAQSGQVSGGRSGGTSNLSGYLARFAGFGNWIRGTIYHALLAAAVGFLSP